MTIPAPMIDNPKLSGMNLKYAYTVHTKINGREKIRFSLLMKIDTPECDASCQDMVMLNIDFCLWRVRQREREVGEENWV